MIESPFVLESASTRHELDPDDRAALGPVLALYPDSLFAATVDRGGTLALRFANGASITFRQHPSYEAWQGQRAGQLRVVCTRGTTGELAIWD